MSDPTGFRGSTIVDATPERVRRALTTLDGVRGWWTPIVTGSVADGGDFDLGFDGLDETIRVTVVASDGDRVEWSVREHTAAPDWGGSRIVFRLRPGASGCVLDLEHVGVDPQHVAAGWEHFLGSIRALVETGRGLPYPRAAAGALAVAMRYHRAWTAGRFAEAVALLAPDLTTDVPIHTYTSREEWAASLTGFGSVVDRADLLSALGDGEEAVLIYDMHTRPYGVLRIAEHFTVHDGSILRIRHVHDTVTLRQAMPS